MTADSVGGAGGQMPTGVLVAMMAGGFALLLALAALSAPPSDDEQQSASPSSGENADEGRLLKLDLAVLEKRIENTFPRGLEFIFTENKTAQPWLETGLRTEAARALSDTLAKVDAGRAEGGNLTADHLRLFTEVAMRTERLGRECLQHTICHGMGDLDRSLPLNDLAVHIDPWTENVVVDGTITNVASFPFRLVEIGVDITDRSPTLKEHGIGTEGSYSKHSKSMKFYGVGADSSLAVHREFTFPIYDPDYVSVSYGVTPTIATWPTSPATALAGDQAAFLFAFLAQTQMEALRDGFSEFEDEFYAGDGEGSVAKASAFTEAVEQFSSVWSYNPLAEASGSLYDQVASAVDLAGSWASYATYCGEQAGWETEPRGDSCAKMAVVHDGTYEALLYETDAMQSWLQEHPLAQRAEFMDAD